MFIAMSSKPEIFEGCITDVIVPENSDISLEDAVKVEEEEDDESENDKPFPTLRIRQREILFFGA